MLRNIKLTMFFIIVSVLVIKVCLANGEEKKNEINKQPDISLLMINRINNYLVYLVYPVRCFLY